jgi:hypothetical protein
MRVGQVLQGNVNGIYYLGRKYLFVYWWGKSVLVWETCDFFIPIFCKGVNNLLGSCWAMS